MPCTGKTAKSDLPVITKAVFAPRVREKKVYEKRPKKRRAIVDYHCPTCGLTKPDYPNFFHKCPGPQPVAYQIARAAKCQECPQNRDGVCLPLQERQPDKPCLVQIGIAMPGAACPIGKWPRVLFRCDKCGSVRFDANGLIVCPACRQKP
jgi:hypothetical protein